MSVYQGSQTARVDLMIASLRNDVAKILHQERYPHSDWALEPGSFRAAFLSEADSLIKADSLGAARAPLRRPHEDVKIEKKFAEAGPIWPTTQEIIDHLEAGGVVEYERDEGYWRGSVILLSEWKTSDRNARWRHHRLRPIALTFKAQFEAEVCDATPPDPKALWVYGAEATDRGDYVVSDLDGNAVARVFSRDDAEKICRDHNEPTEPPEAPEADQYSTLRLQSGSNVEIFGVNGPLLILPTEGDS